eukprot:9468035-Pyramimonas_sp.AAC.1
MAMTVTSAPHLLPAIELLAEHAPEVERLILLDARLQREVGGLLQPPVRVLGLSRAVRACWSRGQLMTHDLSDDPAHLGLGCVHLRCCPLLWGNPRPRRGDDNADHDDGVCESDHDT